MPPPPPFTDWQLLSAELTGPIRLVQTGTGISIYRSTTQALSEDAAEKYGIDFTVTLSAAAISGKAPPDIVIPQRQGSVAAFDAAVSDAGVAVTIDAFGGATSALLFGIESTGFLDVKAPFDDGNDYRFPRFMRGEGLPRGHFITAIVNDSWVAGMLPPSTKPDGSSRKPYVVLADGQDGLAIVTAAPPARRGTPTGTTSTTGTPTGSETGTATQPTNTSPSGTTNGESHATANSATAATGTNGATNGKMPPADALALLVRVERQMGPPSPSPFVEFPGGLFLHQGSRQQLLFDEDGTYAFDADIVAGTLLVAASTLNGPELLVIDLASGATKAIAWPSGYPTTDLWITSPTVLNVTGAEGGKLFAFAFYEGKGERVAGIRYGEIDLAQLT